ncbi:hypothetical protein MPTK1_7g10110 [Marchantia polymorpha subsp. ruderalis]
MQVSSTYAGKVRIGMGRNGMEWNRMQPKGGRDGRKVSDTRVGLEDGKKEEDDRVWRRPMPRSRRSVQRHLVDGEW